MSMLRTQDQKLHKRAERGIISGVRGLAATSAAHALRDVLRNRSIRRIEIAWAMGTAADWGLLVVLLVVAYDAGGTLAAGVLGAVRVLPGIVAAPFATTLVERYRGDRVLTVINLVRAAGALATALVVASDLPVELTYLLAALVAGAGSLVRPIQAALLPAFARTPGELVAANVASSTGEGIGTFLGPLAAGLLVAATGSTTASLVVAAGFAAAAAAATGISFEHAADARGGAGVDRATRLRLSDVPRMLRRYPGAAVLVGDFVAQIFVRGLLVTLIVVAALELLEMGDSGVGLLNAAIGLGGLAGAIAALRLAGDQRLGAICVIALACWGLPLLFIGVWPVAALALSAFFVVGVSNAVLDISGFTLIQRGVRTEDRMTVFGMLEGLLGVGAFAGSLLAPALVAILGGRGAFLVAGAILPLLAVATWRPIVRGAERTAVGAERLALLRRNPLFAPLPLTALDRLSESMVARSYEAGDVIMRKGEPGEDYVLVAEGEVEVTDDERLLRVCAAGDGVGEIALLHRVPRTATVKARTKVECYAIDADAFLVAVAGPTAAALAHAVAEARLERSRELGAAGV